MDADRVLAWGGMEFYFMGALFCIFSDNRKTLAFKAAEGEPFLAACLYVVFGYDKFCDL